MAVNPKAGFCEAEILLATVLNPTVAGKNLRFSIGITNITGNIAVGAGLTTPAQIQALIDADATYQASGTTIIVTSFDGSGLMVVIRKKSSTQLATAKGFYGVDFGETQTSEFTCKRTSSGRSGLLKLPYYIYVPVIGTPSPFVSYLGVTYDNPTLIERGVEKKDIYRYTKTLSTARIAGSVLVFPIK